MASLREAFFLFAIVTCIASDDSIKEKIDDFITGFLECTDTIGVSLAVVEDGKVSLNPRSSFFMLKDYRC